MQDRQPFEIVVPCETINDLLQTWCRTNRLLFDHEDAEVKIQFMSQYYETKDDEWRVKVKVLPSPKLEVELIDIT